MTTLWLLAQSSSSIAAPAIGLSSGEAAVGVLGTLGAFGGLVTAAFRWLAARDDKREEQRLREREADRAEAEKARAAHAAVIDRVAMAVERQADACRDEMAALTAAFREEREMDRKSRHEMAGRLQEAVAEAAGAARREEKTK